ncbi:Malate:quinone oxidoreductase [hydrothermal vent metagenome]|uniref:Malate:quinone oxidoreductase n=1 Tax=hydrothermal vent metagenome TaxID=652676 RepID=A0A3B1BB67_9ZZZZ
MAKQPVYDVLIIGGGVSGTALLYQLARFTDLRRIALLEKYSDVATVNSHGRNNSQTLHCGDIETNYSLEKAREVQRTARMLVNFSLTLPNHDQWLFKHSKMVIGVGEQEGQFLRQRYETFSADFPAMRFILRDEIAGLEQHVVKGRKEVINAIAILDEYTTVNFSELSKAFVQQAQAVQGKQVELALNTYAGRISKDGEHFQVETNKGRYRARFVVVCAGGHSLLFAHQMGHGLNYSCLPMAGSFYYAPKLLQGKVYTVQNDKLPFAAIHGDPDILVPDKSRLGPTALMTPVLERYNIRTLPEFLRVLRLDLDVIRVMWDLFKVPDIRNYIFKNMLFEVPLVRRRLFLQDARKIIPALQLKDLEFASRIGGVRPVMIDKQARKLHMGEAKIDTGEGIIFNMTPSPGATSCLGNAEGDLRIIADYLGCQLDETAFAEILLGEDKLPLSNKDIA